MIEIQKYLEGQIVDGRYSLTELLGSTQHSSVFRTECDEAPNRQAAIKLISAPAATSGAQLTRWRLAARFSHPALLRVYDMGRCEFEDRPMLYVVTELAEENLGDILPVRCLSPGETSAMLSPALEALTYLHGKGFVHGQLRPSNILAIGDQVKLSSDSIARIGEVADARDAHDSYRAPEVSLSAASDVWSLGITVVQCLTGRVPERAPDARNSVSISADVPAPFLDFVRHCLNPVSQRRWSVAQLQAALGHRPTAASAQEPVEAATNEPASAHAAASAFANPAAVVPTRLRFGFSLNKKYRLALAALAAATAAFILGIVISSGSSEINATPSAAVAGPAGGSQMSTPTNHPRVAVPAKSHIDTSHWTQATKLAALNGNSAKPTKDAAPKLRQPPRPENYTPGVIVTSVTPAASTPSVEATSPISGDLIPGAVSRRALPRVPTSASNTIWGTVRVSVIVDVDPRGRVVEAKLDTPGPSRYFASLSMAAAQDWKFTPPRVEGNVVPSEWLINFGYSKTDVSAAATEKHP